MDMTLFRKNVIFKEFNINNYLPQGLEILHRRSENNENYASLMGTKQQINNYLQDKPILSERLRTLNNVPKWREINCKMVRIQ
jgi:hypothetical protein